MQQQGQSLLEQAGFSQYEVSAYAKNNNLRLKSLYAARALLVDKGALSPPDKAAPLTGVHHPALATSVACKVILANGVQIEFADINISSLFSCVAQL